jgi:hypothetical protein
LVVFLFFACFCLLASLPVLMFVATYIFRLACRLCGLPTPGVLVSSGKMFVSWVTWAIVVAIMHEGVLALCAAAGVPKWEAEIATWLLALPLNLVISSGIHALFQQIRYGKAVEVWFVEHLIQLGIVVGILFIIALVLLVQALAA